MSKINLNLNSRDCDILRYLYEYRFLNTELLWHLLNDDHKANYEFFSIGNDGRKRPSKYGFGRQALYKRLRRLFKYGYVQRHYLTDLPFGKGYGIPRAVYGLGSNSSKVLSDLYQIPQQTTYAMICNNKIRSPFLRHVLELASFRIILELACRRSKGRISLCFWEQGLSIRDYVYGKNMDGEKERLSVYPDAFFGLQIAGQRNRHFFLEIDRGTEPIVTKAKRTNIRGKLLGFQAYYTSKKLSQVQFGKINGFQVLFVTPGQIHENGTITGRAANILKEITSNSKTYITKSLFLLTTPDSFSLESPETIFSSIWVSPKSSNKLLSLVE